MAVLIHDGGMFLPYDIFFTNATQIEVNGWCAGHGGGAQEF